MSPPLVPYFRKFKHWCLSQTTRFGMELSASGIAYFQYRGETKSILLRVFSAPESLTKQLQRLRSNGRCTLRSRKFELTWSEVYAIISEGDSVLISQLQLEDIEVVRLAVVSTGRIGDGSLAVSLDTPFKVSKNSPSFLRIDDKPVPVSTNGRLLSVENFHLMEQVGNFRKKPYPFLVSPDAEATWGRIVTLANIASADVSRFTTQRTFLDIERLRLVLCTTETQPGFAALELVPYFSGSPPRWKETFMGHSELPECYDVPGRAGRTQVDVCPEVAPILFDARRMLGRNVIKAPEVMRHLQIIDQSDVEDMSPEAFELVCALIYRKSGYTRSFRVGGSGDGGVDVVALRGARGLLLQCKSSKELDKRLGWEGVKDVVAGEAGYRIQYPGVQFQKLALTNQYFNETAKSQALLNNVVLLDKTDILKEIKKLHISYFELRHFSKGAV